jgi:hypothetical protein
VPTRISAPAAARDFAIAQPYPWSSATPAINALLPTQSTPSVGAFLFFFVKYASFFHTVVSINLVDVQRPGH